MTYDMELRRREERGREKGREEGRTEGRLEVLKSLAAAGLLSLKDGVRGSGNDVVVLHPGDALYERYKRYFKGVIS